MTLRPLFLAASILLIAATPAIPPREQRGRADADCRTNEPGPAIRVAVSGLKDSRGMLRLELYPANDTDFLAADKQLIAEGKVFRRVLQRPSASGASVLCVRAPSAGRYALSVLHDRDGDTRFGFLQDGVGVSNNPKFRRAKPKGTTAAVQVGPGVTSTRIILNYRKGLSFGPLASKTEDRSGS